MAFEQPTFVLQFDQDEQKMMDSQTSEATSTQKADKTGHADSSKPFELESNSSNYFSKELNYNQTSPAMSDQAAEDQFYNDDETQVTEYMGDESGIIQQADVTKYDNFSELLRDMGQESRMVLLQFSQVFGDSEVYEQQVSQAITDLTAHAQMLQQQLQDQKTMLYCRISRISESLKDDYSEP